MNKKKLLSLALAVIMIATISFSTLAWFSDADEVKNEFLVAGSDDQNPDDIFSVDVWEDINGDGKEDTTSGHTYEDILPGDKLTKIAKVENTGSYDQYVRVTITISDAKAWVKALGRNFDPLKLLLDGYDASKWNLVWNNLNGHGPVPENIVLVMYYKGVLKPGEVIDVIDAVKIPGSLTQEQAAEFDGGFSVDIKAEAVQTENVVPAGTKAGNAAEVAFETVGLAIAE